MLGMSAEQLKGHLDPLVLAVLEGEPAHGYAIIESLRNGSDGVFDLPEGTIYPALHRLERAGTVTSRREVTSGRGYLSQSELPITFGLGKATKIDRVTIEWPGKKAGKQELTDLEINKTQTVKQK